MSIFSALSKPNWSTFHDRRLADEKLGEYRVRHFGCAARSAFLTASLAAIRAFSAGLSKVGKR